MQLGEQAGAQWGQGPALHLPWPAVPLSSNPGPGAVPWGRCLEEGSEMLLPARGDRQEASLPSKLGIFWVLPQAHPFRLAR